MKLSCSLVALIICFLCVCCAPCPVNGQTDLLVGQLKGQIAALDSTDLAGESNARIVRKALDKEFQVFGIGEQSHGTSEFFTARLLLIRALAADPALTKIGLEAPMAEVDKLNEYLLEGRGDLKSILRSFRLYGYECREFVDLVENVGRIIRDSLMAENVLAEIEPGKKMVILAHNAHLQHTPNIFSKSVGSFLSRKLGTSYQCVGLTTSYGFYTTFNPKAGHITDKNKVFAGDSTTWEYHFSKLDQPAFFFNTALLKRQPKGIRLPEQYRLLVYGLADNQFFDGALPDDFDYILHLRQTSGNQSFYLR